MAAMAPFFATIQALDGFEFACFCLASFVGFMLAGFLVDYLMGRQAFGPYVNAGLTLIGFCAALYARYNFLGPYVRYEPYLTCGVLFAAPALLIVTLSFLRTRLA